MTRAMTSHIRRLPPWSEIDPLNVLNALPQVLLVVGADHRIRFVNFEAQEFFDASEVAMIGLSLTELIPPDSPIFTMIDQAQAQTCTLSDYGVSLDTPRTGHTMLTVTAAPLSDPPDAVVVTLQPISIARRIDNQLTHRNAARSITAMGAMLAHEVKNPLSGIRGAAQLLEQNAADSDRALTRLICDEADRIVALVDRMEAFSSNRPIERGPVNIHSVLEHVRRLAQSGFARNIRFVERYDPSLPPAAGHRDQLIQVFLNLVKNAAEAVPDDSGEIILSTAYQRGVSISLPGQDNRLQLPLLITVQDNGDGIPADLHDNLFDPFVTTRKNGTGLGLALVAKIIGDHGGIIGFESRPRRTLFKVSLPIFSGHEPDPAWSA
ncbi:MAG: PAS domain-containing protein [Rhodospirillaceae bacterium]|nr:PAS domain-containing protein [Rhodospirillaceae bacterium]